jgi:hypothetical protein
VKPVPLAITAPIRRDWYALLARQGMCSWVLQRQQSRLMSRLKMDINVQLAPTVPQCPELLRPAPREVTSRLLEHPMRLHVCRVPLAHTKIARAWEHACLAPRVQHLLWVPHFVIAWAKTVLFNPAQIPCCLHYACANHRSP